MEGTYVHAHICVFVDRRWEEQEIPRFASPLELGIQPSYNLLWGESFGGFGGGHDPPSESSSGITIEADAVSGTGSCNPGADGDASSSRTEHGSKSLGVGF